MSQLTPPHPRPYRRGRKGGAAAQIEPSLRGDEPCAAAVLRRDDGGQVTGESDELQEAEEEESVPGELPSKYARSTSKVSIASAVDC